MLNDGDKRNAYLPVTAELNESTFHYSHDISSQHTGKRHQLLSHQSFKVDSMNEREGK